jgi:hypothetical protein
MSHTKDPAAKVFAGSAQLQVPEQREEHFLRDFFRVMQGHANRQYVAEKRIAKLIEEVHYLAFDLRRLRRRWRGSRSRKRQRGERIYRTNTHGFLYIYIPFFSLLFKILEGRHRNPSQGPKKAEQKAGERNIQIRVRKKARLISSMALIHLSASVTLYLDDPQTTEAEPS